MARSGINVSKLCCHDSCFCAIFPNISFQALSLKERPEDTKRATYHIVVHFGRLCPCPVADKRKLGPSFQFKKCFIVINARKNKTRARFRVENSAQTTLWLSHFGCRLWVELRVGCEALQNKCFSKRRYVKKTRGGARHDDPQARMYLGMLFA